MFEYNEFLLTVLIHAGYNEQGPVGAIPSDWAQRHNIESFAPLPNYQMNRQHLREFCQNPLNHVLDAYLCVMAWGIQYETNIPVVWNSIENRDRLSVNLSHLRNDLSRQEAFQLFLNNPIEGLGPSFFTKLIYFFRKNPNAYIMDTNTCKAILLLTGKHLIRHSNGYPVRQNANLNYEIFCKVIEELMELLNRNNGEEVEEMLFSNKKGLFRSVANWYWINRKPIFGRYNSNNLNQYL